MSAPQYDPKALATCQAFERRFGRDIPEFAGWLKGMEREYGRAALGVACASFADPEDDTWRASLAFAVEHWPGCRLSSDYWKLMLKRALGRAAYIGLHDRLRRRATPSGPAWHDHGMQIGWWPEAEPAAG